MSGQRKAPQTRRRKAGPAKAETPLRRRVRKTLKWTGITGLVLALLATLTFIVLYRAIDIPDPNADFQTETTYVYYSDGKSELGRYAEQNRNSIPLSEMPDFVKDGVVAAEDRTFWTNNGIDPRGIVRAAFSNASGNDTQGASTITQQYVKILYLTQEQSYKRKVREAVVSLKLHRQQSKEQILEGYLNTIYFGRGAYGIDAAAQTWFRKSAKDLTLRESAVLSSVINNPTLYDPANGKHNRQSLKSRFGRVLNAMAETGAVSAEQATKAAKKLPAFPKAQAETTYGGQKGHALAMIRKELQRLGFSDPEIQGGGLRVTTTLTKKAMDAAEQGVDEARPEGVKGLHVAAASVEPGTGALRGFYGGQDYLDSQVNWAVSGGLPGSTFKLFALAAGIDAGFALKDTFEGNSPFEFAEGQRPVRNLGGGDGTDYGRVDLIRATEDSINTAFVDLTMALPDGPKDVLKMAKAMGIPGDDKSRGLNNLRTSPGLSANPGIALGSATVSPINMANGYATVAANGVRSDVYMIEKVVDRTGETRYSHKVSNKQVLDEDINADVSYALQQVVRAGSGQREASQLGRPAGGKTGTATNADDEVSSSWFVGYTPQLSTAVMMVRGTGNESLEDLLPTSYYGGTYPARMWTRIMDAALEGEDIESLPDAAWTDGEAPSEGHAPPPPPPPKPTKTKKPPKTPEDEPTDEPTQEPTDEPTQEPTDRPTQEPTDEPTVDPTPSCGPLGCPPTPSDGVTGTPRMLPPGTRD